jgi:ATP-dependent Zn protease
MLSWIVFGFVLFIGGIIATMVYDYRKARAGNNVSQPRGSLSSTYQTPSQNTFSKQEATEQMIKKLLAKETITAEDFKKLFSGKL